jgi:hypothetical protein
VGQVFPLFPSPLRLPYAGRCARPISLASPNSTKGQNKPLSHTTHWDPVRKTVFCISIQNFRPGSGVHVFTGYGGGGSWWGMKLTDYGFPVPRLRMSGAIPPSICVFKVSILKALYFTWIKYTSIKRYWDNVAGDNVTGIMLLGIILLGIILLGIMLLGIMLLG